MEGRGGGGIEWVWGFARARADSGSYGHLPVVLAVESYQRGKGLRRAREVKLSGKSSRRPLIPKSYYEHDRARFYETF